MSFSRMNRKVRDDVGKEFPIDPGADTAATFALIVADALRRDFGTSPAKVKHIARLTGANVRTVQNWIYARNGPSGSGLVVLMRHSDAVMEAVLSLAGRPEFQERAKLGQAVHHLRAALVAGHRGDAACADSGAVSFTIRI